MSNRKKRDVGARNCVCSVCEAEAHSIPEKPHRKCKRDELKQRGIWR